MQCAPPHAGLRPQSLWAGVDRRTATQPFMYLLYNMSVYFKLYESDGSVFGFLCLGVLSSSHDSSMTEGRLLRHHGAE
jgi:hypothetical protein